MPAAAATSDATALEVIAGEQRAIEAASKLVSLIAEQRTLLEKMHQVRLSAPAEAHLDSSKAEVTVPAPVALAPTEPVAVSEPEPPSEPTEPLWVALARVQKRQAAPFIAEPLPTVPSQELPPLPHLAAQPQILLPPAAPRAGSSLTDATPAPFDFSSALGEPSKPAPVQPKAPPSAALGYPPTQPAVTTFAGGPVERPPMIIERAQAEHLAGGIDRTDEPEPSRVPAFFAGFGLAMAVGVMLYLVRAGG